MPLSENRRSMTLLAVDFHNTLISNILRLLNFSQIYIIFFQLGTLAKIGVIHPLIIRAFQSTKILVFLKRIKKRHLFIHLRNFQVPMDCKIKIKTLIFITLKFFIFSQIVFPLSTCFEGVVLCHMASISTKKRSESNTKFAPTPICHVAQLYSPCSQQTVAS